MMLAIAKCPAVWRGCGLLVLAALVFVIPARAVTGTPALAPAIAALAALPGPQRTTSVAAHVSLEGHWTLVNAAGEAFTAATADELKRGWDILLPKLSAAGGKATIYVSAPTAFDRRKRVGDLPPTATLWLADSHATLPLTRSGASGLLASVRPRLLVELSDAAAFAETLALLATPVDRSAFRLLALEPGGPHTLPARMRVDAATKRPEIDAIDPNFLVGALGALRGQTALLVGRLEGDLLSFNPATGAERSLGWGALTASATASDVNLIVLKSATGQQPGGRNWLWQTIAVKGLDEALTRATLADAFEALAGDDGALVVSTTLVSADRSVLDVRPSSALSAGTWNPRTWTPGSWSPGKLASVLTDAASGLTGSVTHQGAMAHLRSTGRQTELDRRLVPFVPSVVQWVYGGLLLLGALGWPVARRWWARVWPAETVADYGNATGYWAARGMRGAAFVLVFLPLAAPLAAPRALIRALSRPQSSAAVSK